MITIDFPNGVVRFDTDASLEGEIIEKLIDSPRAAIDQLGICDGDDYYPYWIDMAKKLDEMINNKDKEEKETKSDRLPERLSESVKHTIAAELKRADRDHKVAIYRILNRRGLSNLEIAEVLDVPPSTVRAYEHQNQINMTCDELNDLGRLALNNIMQEINKYNDAQKSLAHKYVKETNFAVSTGGDIETAKEE